MWILQPNWISYMGIDWVLKLGITLEIPSKYWWLQRELGGSVWLGADVGVTQWELIGPRAPTIVRAAPSSSTDPLFDLELIARLATIVASLPPSGLPGCPPWWCGRCGGRTMESPSAWIPIRGQSGNQLPGNQKIWINWPSKMALKCH